jgi:hypothetical protein
VAAAFAILKSMRSRRIAGLVLAAVLAGSGVAHADEILLKDGTKISGTIVGYEGDSFKVEMPYGFALIRKDKIAEIVPSTSGNDHAAKSKTAAPVAPVATPAVAKNPSAPPVAPAKATAPATERRTVAENPITHPVKTEPEPPKEKIATADPAPPPAPPAPPVIRDDVRGNLYVNYTYGFQMYKPPSWDLIPEARKALPDAVAALGTYDETTLLVVGRERAKDSLDAHAAATEKALREIYENYRAISGRRTTIAGSPAIEKHFRGTVDGHDWSVLLMTFLHGGDVYTLLGMTWADSDLIQLQENVIAKTVNSLEFNLPRP